jgi:hypothetical protein
MDALPLMMMIRRMIHNHSCTRAVCDLGRDQPRVHDLMCGLGILFSKEGQYYASSFVHSGGLQNKVHVIQFFQAKIPSYVGPRNAVVLL